MADFTSEQNKQVPDDSGETVEERLDWLRSRGIKVETPEDRKNEKFLLETLRRLKVGDPDTKSFKYVFIPADDSKPLAEETATIPKSLWFTDQFPVVLKTKFTQGTIDEVSLRKTAEKHLVGNVNAGDAFSNNLTPQTLAGHGGAVETFKLAENVNLYLDEVGALKQLSKNKRASALANRCGFGDVPFFGDMYIGRVVSGRNVDFNLSDMDPSAKWLIDAPAYNLSKQAEQHAAGLPPVGMDADAVNSVGGEGEGYKWTQTPEDVEVTVALPSPGTKGRDCKITFARRSLKITIQNGGTFTFDPLFGEIHPDDSTWTVGDGNLIVTMEKAKEGMVWSALS